MPIIPFANHFRRCRTPEPDGGCTGKIFELTWEVSAAMFDYQRERQFQCLMLRVLSLCYDLHPSYTPLNVPNLSVLHTFSIFQQKPPQAPQPSSPLVSQAVQGVIFLLCH